MPITIPDNIKKDIQQLIRSDANRRVYLSHIIKSQLNANLDSKHKIHVIDANETRRVNLNVIRDRNKVRENETNLVTLTTQFEEMLTEYENNPLSETIQRFIEQNLARKEGEALYNALDEMDKAFDACYQSPNGMDEALNNFFKSLEVNSQYVTEITISNTVTTTHTNVATTSTNTSVTPISSVANTPTNVAPITQVNSNDETLGLVVKIVGAAPFLFASFQMVSELTSLRQIEECLVSKISRLSNGFQHRSSSTQANGNNADVKDPRFQLAIIRKQINLCGEGALVTFLNKNRQYHAICYLFTDKFKALFKDKPVVMQAFVDAVLGKKSELKYEQGLMQGDIAPLVEFLKAQPEIRLFLKKHIDSLHAASDAYAQSMNGAFDYRHVDDLLRDDLKQLLKNIRSKINELCTGIEKKVKSSHLSDSIYEKDTLFKAVNNCNKILREAVVNIQNQCTNENKQLTPGLIVAALTTLRKTLTSECAKIRDVSNRMPGKTEIHGQLAAEMMTTLDELYVSTSKMSDRAAVFSRIYKTIPTQDVRLLRVDEFDEVGNVDGNDDDSEEDFSFVDQDGSGKKFN